MDSRLDLIVKDKNNCIIDGYLIRNNILKFLPHINSFISNATAPIISCSKVKACDSAGIAVLVQCWQGAHKDNKKLIVSDITSTMQAMISLSEVDQLLDVTLNT